MSPLRMQMQDSGGNRFGISRLLGESCSQILHSLVIVIDELDARITRDLQKDPRGSANIRICVRYYHLTSRQVRDAWRFPCLEESFR